MAALDGSLTGPQTEETSSSSIKSQKGAIVMKREEETQAHFFKCKQGDPERGEKDWGGQETKTVAEKYLDSQQRQATAHGQTASQKGCRGRSGAARPSLKDADELQLVQVLGSERLTYEVFDGLKLLVIKSLSKVRCLTYLQEVLHMDKGTFDPLSVITILSKAWPGMNASAKEEVFNALCGPTQEGATPEEGTPGPAGVREVTEAMGDIAIDSGLQKPTVTSTGTKSVKSGNYRLKTEPDLDHELEAEKTRLGQEVCARIKTKPLSRILKFIGCIKEYNEFIKEHKTEIKELMKFLPKTLAGKNEEEQQAACMPLLERLIDMANEIWRPKDPTPESPRQYYLYDTHKHPPEGTKLKLDALVSTDIKKRLDTAELVVEFKQNEDRGDITTKGTQSIYGQLGVCARRVWARQPMRRFVPVFLVHGMWVTLFLFTRSTVHRADVGSALAGGRANEIVVRLLLFLLSSERTNLGIILPHDLGDTQTVSFSPSFPKLFCQRLGVEIDDNAIIQQQQQQPTSPCSDNHPITSHFEINNVVRLSRPDLFGRIAFLARGTLVYSDGKRTNAVLKFVRREAVRQAEGEAYGVLDWKEVPHVPKLLLSGYADEWGSGVLECLVVADAGQPLREYRAGDVDARRDPKLLERVSTVVTQCLWDASKAGVYHRDISIGNICVDEDGTVRVIDWGCARVEPETLQDYRDDLMGKFPSDPSLASLPAAKKVAGNEEEHDPFTGTPHFLSARVLLRRKYRSVVDDIESILYVLIFFVAKDRDACKNAPMWENNLPARQLAINKAALFTCIDYFYKWAGLVDLDLLTQRDLACLNHLKTLARRLFLGKEGATSVMCSLLNEEDDPRKSYDLKYWLSDDPQQATSPDSAVDLAAQKHPRPN
ncbi:hypothetical protein EV182_001256 [Spiromyces aspiralis]|uniref:Uncharacterized protein n=1 Tax=Spiromyces aspiralis TaxID=68401 RepID=A0ACC1HNE1_9FUNG|nr:hypothetical protein EV182_001256 [Spiromyces aspiralis]